MLKLAQGAQGIEQDEEEDEPESVLVVVDPTSSKLDLKLTLSAPLVKDEPRNQLDDLRKLWSFGLRVASPSSEVAVQWEDV